MKKKAPSSNIAFSLSLRYMLLLAFAMLSLSAIFLGFLQFSVVSRQNKSLKEGLSLLSSTLEKKGADDLAFLDLPYFITYVVYEIDSKKIIATNDSLLPLLTSEGRSSTYFEKDYFTDSDLNIRYQTGKITLKGKGCVVEVALDIVNDSAGWMLELLPSLALVSLLPVLLIAFGLSFLISRKTIFAFKKLQEDYDRERTFSSNVSHELKTPISIIDGHANLLKRWGKNDPAQLDQSIDAILQETESMNAIVSTLLEMSRLDQGKIEVEKDRFFVTNLFQSLKEEFTSLHPRMTFEIVDKDFLFLDSDEKKIHQIFTVALSNSVKFAGEDCKITLEAKKIGPKIELSARDNGPGFPLEAIHHVFERFYKGDQSHDRNAGGSGLGLSIAKSLADLLGASIRAENAREGGAKISVLF